jgi:hypothetical protein
MHGTELALVFSLVQDGTSCAIATHGRRPRRMLHVGLFSRGSALFLMGLLRWIIWRAQQDCACVDQSVVAPERADTVTSIRELR